MDEVYHAPAELTCLSVQVWTIYWTEIEQQVGSLFARSDARSRAIVYLAGLLSPAERKNSWQLAEISGDITPHGFQHLLGRVDWDPDALCRRSRSYVSDYLADPDAIGVIGETSFLAGLLYSFFGWQLNPILAAAAMAFSSVFVVTNSLRLRKVRLLSHA